jgi:hypothetical protein
MRRCHPRTALRSCSESPIGYLTLHGSQGTRQDIPCHSPLDADNVRSLRRWRCQIVTRFLIRNQAQTEQAPNKPWTSRDKVQVFCGARDELMMN